MKKGMLYSIIQIGPEILNNTTNIASQPSTGYDILQGAVALLVGFLIFFGFGFHFRLIKFIDKTKERKPKYRYDPEAWLLLIMVVAAVISAICSLLGNAEVMKASDARLFSTSFFIVSLLSMSCFAFMLLYKYHFRGQ